MKIAFVGKGGSGKTTTSMIFVNFASEKTPVMAIDADINMNLSAELSRGCEVAHLSDKGMSDDIKKYLIGDNHLIEKLSHFRKSTPPSKGSNLIDPLNKNDKFIKKYLREIHPNLNLGIIGTYSEDEIGSSCYHNNLAIAENILSHSINNRSVICYDMVAGTDAFAGTLYSQFDLLVFVVEPTKKSLEVFHQYQKLAEKAGIKDLLKAIGNKVTDKSDEDFLRDRLRDDLIGVIYQSKYLKAVDRGEKGFSLEDLEMENKKWLGAVWKELDHNYNRQSDQQRLERLWKAHAIYAKQPHVMRAVGDITIQIDKDFRYEE